MAGEAKVEIKGGDRLQQKLAEIARGLATASSVRCGYLSGATYPDGTSVATVAVANNWGTDKIPARPFFTNMVEDNQDGWPDLIQEGLRRSGMDAKKALEFTGQIITEQLQASILKGNFVPLNPKTVARKGFATPLVDQAVMLNSGGFEVE